MKRKFFFIFIPLVFFLITIQLSTGKALANSWTCTLENVPNLTSDNTYFPSGIVIDTGGNAARGGKNQYQVLIYTPEYNRLIDTGGLVRRSVTIKYKDGSPINFQAETDGKIIINHSFDWTGKSLDEINPSRQNPPLPDTIGDVSGYKEKIKTGKYQFQLVDSSGDKRGGILCEGDVDTENPLLMTEIKSGPQAPKSDKCSINFKSDLKPGSPIFMRVDFKDGFEKNVDDKQFDVFVNWATNRLTFEGDNQKSAAELMIGFDELNPFNFDGRTFAGGEHTVTIRKSSGIIGGEEFGCSNFFTIGPGGGIMGCRDSTSCTNTSKPNCRPDPEGRLVCSEITTNPAKPNPCDPDSEGNAPYKCQTAIGEISTDIGGFIKSVLVLILSLSGGIIVLIIIMNGYKLIMSQGDPEKVKEARESVTSAIAGLLLIIFSIAILQFITVEVLQLPGFGS